MKRHVVLICLAIENSRSMMATSLKVARSVVLFLAFLGWYQRGARCHWWRWVIRVQKKETSCAVRHRKKKTSEFVQQNILYHNPSHHPETHSDRDNCQTYGAQGNSSTGPIRTFLFPILLKSPRLRKYLRSTQYILSICQSEIVAV